MSATNLFIAYHATDNNNIKSIFDEGFHYNYYKYHWLGNGVYFFIDENLAQKWGKSHLKQYGQIHNCVILKVTIEVEKDFLCDLRQLDEYCSVKEKFDEYMEMLSSLSIRFKEDSAEKFYQRLRCAFFDWLKKEMNLKCVISYFSERQRTLPSKIKNEDDFLQFKIPYMEVQLCLYDTSCITKKEIV